MTAPLVALAVRQLPWRRLESGLFQLLLAAGLLTVVSGLGDVGFLLATRPEPAEVWDWDADLGLLELRKPISGQRRAPEPELHAVGGRASRRRERAATSSTTSATVLPWPSRRHQGTANDPDLPGGA